MIKSIRFAVAGLVLSTVAAFAAPLDGQQTYDLLFRNGTLDEISKKDALVYSRGVTNALKPDTETRDSGEISLSFRTTEQNAVMAQLKLSQGDKSRSLGVFPASVGNPMIMYFYETVVRDMAEAAGGSPYYIRNRVKDSLIQPSDIQTGSVVLDGKTVETQIVRLYPFATDPNKERMKGFGDLELTVTMSEDVPGWYISLVASAAREGADPVYNSELRFQRLEVAE